MDIGPALVTLVVIVAAVTALGVVLRRRDGRITVARAGGDHIAATDVGLDRFAEHATLVQFSTETCARCPGARRLLSTVAAEYDDVTHVDVDLTYRADLAARFRVMQTPTTFILDSAGLIRARIAGVPVIDAVHHQLADLRKEHHVSTHRN